MDQSLVHVSKFLSLVLRHRPEVIGLRLDAEGWVAIRDLVEAASRAGTALTEEVVRRVVETNDKKRFAMSADGLRIRASQGHSIHVDLGLEPVAPPEDLYHGTVARFLDSIRREGLTKGSRQHVHLSGDGETATRVGQRRGRPVVLCIRAGEMAQAGFVFFRSENGVWLTERVPAEYIVFPELPSGRTEAS